MKSIIFLSFLLFPLLPLSLPYTAPTQHMHITSRVQCGVACGGCGGGCGGVCPHRAARVRPHGGGELHALPQRAHRRHPTRPPDRVNTHTHTASTGKGEKRMQQCMNKGENEKYSWKKHTNPMTKHTNSNTFVSITRYLLFHNKLFSFF